MIASLPDYVPVAPDEAAEGFYWVRKRDGTMEVARWDSGRWWLTGNPIAHTWETLTLLSADALEPPTLAPPTIDVDADPEEESLIQGDRVRLLAMPEDPDPIPSGERGTVERVIRVVGPDGGKMWRQVWVKWDSGRTLMLSIPPDRVVVLATRRGDI